MSDERLERQLLNAAQSGDADAIGQLFTLHRDRLSRMVRLRLDRRIQRRTSPSDVLQETYLEATTRLKEFFAQADTPFYVWLRFLTFQRLAQIHRFHLGTQARDATREVSIDREGMFAVESSVLAAELVGKLTSPSVAAQKLELQKRLQELLDAMPPLDREILTLRHFEQLTNIEAANALGMSPAAASTGYMRALERLRTILTDEAGIPLDQ